MKMRTLLNTLVGSHGADHRAVFADFAEGLMRVLVRRTARARVRAVGG